MKISPITFCGINGVEYPINPENDEEGHMINYYPYKGETQESIDQFVKSNSKPYNSDFDRNVFQPSVDVKVCEELPFTEKEHEIYEVAPWKLPLSKRTVIGSILHEIGIEDDVLTRTKRLLNK